MRKLIFQYEYKDRERGQTLVVDPETGRVTSVALTTWSETIRPRHRLTRRDVELTA